MTASSTTRAPPHLTHIHQERAKSKTNVTTERNKALTDSVRCLPGFLPAAFFNIARTGYLPLPKTKLDNQPIRKQETRPRNP